MEADAVRAAAKPATVASLVHDLRSLGVVPGATLLVHASLSRLGWVAGGEHAVVLALLEAVGPGGTLVMPTHSSQLTDPRTWGNPPVPPEWWPAIRAGTPAFDPALTPTRGMGRVVECFRHVPDVLRSDHPTVSFAALGPLAARITASSPLESGLGEGSPLAALYDLDADVLLLGIDHASNTSLHLAEHRCAYAGKSTLAQGSPVTVDGTSGWVSYEELDVDGSDFAALGEAFAGTGAERCAPVGAGTARLMRQREVVDFAVAWLPENRRTEEA
jgi:aminoglycoside 3-N-acetyltransferase